jgi:hypothetical protein
MRLLRRLALLAALVRLVAVVRATVRMVVVVVMLLGIRLAALV